MLDKYGIDENVGSPGEDKNLPTFGPLEKVEVAESTPMKTEEQTNRELTIEQVDSPELEQQQSKTPFQLNKIMNQEEDISIASTTNQAKRYGVKRKKIKTLAKPNANGAKKGKAMPLS